MSTMSCDAIVAGDHDYYGHQPHSGEKVVAMETNNNILDKPCNASSCYSRSQLANGFGKRQNLAIIPMYIRIIEVAKLMIMTVC